MEIRETGLTGLIEIFPKIFHDHRGWFTESYNTETFKSHGLKMNFVQDNLSFSKAGVLRGLHFQKPPYEQGKLVKVLVGEALDVAVDIRKDSPTFGKYFKVVLSSEKQNMLYLPPGFAHGFLAIKDTYLFYKCTQTYNGAYDSGIFYNDPDLNIDWEYDAPLISEKDKNLPSFAAYKSSIGM